MNRFDTEGLDLDTGEWTERLAKSYSFTQPADTSSPLDPTDSQLLPATTFGPVRSAVAAVVTAFGITLVDRNNSQFIHPVLQSVVLCSRQQHDEQVAKFFEPVRFNWSKQRYRVKTIARNFSENTYADYPDPK